MWTNAQHATIETNNLCWIGLFGRKNVPQIIYHEYCNLLHLIQFNKDKNVIV
jgi:hypothetical protein